MALSAGLLRGLIAGLAELYSPVPGPDYPARAVSVETSMLTADSCSYNHFSADAVLAWQIEPGDVGVFPDSEQLFRQHLHQHPVLACHRESGDGPAQRISDFLSDRQFRSLGLYREFYRPSGVNYQLAITVPAPGKGMIGIAVNRQHRDFTDDEAELLDLLRPHVGQAAATCSLLSQTLAVTPCTPEGRLILTPRQARIVELVAAGYPDRAIGRALGISIRTVHAHLRNIYRALDVTSRTEALAKLRAMSWPAATP